MSVWVGKVAALFSTLLLASQAVWAGPAVGTAFANGDGPTSRTLQPGQTFTLTVSTLVQGAASGLQFNQIALNPNVASQFQIVGGTCNTTTTYSGSTSCTVIVQFIGNQPGAATADLQMGCTALAAVGGYQISCALGSGAGAVGTMARLVGTGVAAAVDALGREGITLLALALCVLTAGLSLRRRA